MGLALRTDGDSLSSQHVVQLYEHDTFLVGEIDRFIDAGLGAGDAAIVIATGPHRDQLEELFRARGLNLDLAREEGRYVSLDAAEVLSTFMVDRCPDGTRFADVVGAIIAGASDGRRRRVRAFGEMVALLWADGEREAAIHLEKLWNDLAHTLPFSLLCAYPISGFENEADETSLQRICGEHSHVLPAESYATLATDDQRLRAITQLQQKARALETEVLQRKQAEEALRERNQTLRRARGEAEAANRAKDEFLAMLGHELRNPLAAVQNAVVTARLDPSRRDRALDIARRGADQLGRLVAGLLDVARITQGRIPLRKERLPLASIVERAVETTRPLIEERSHAITVSLPGSDVVVDGDATRLEQVIGNLISNAAKYTAPGGRITVAVDYDNGEAVLRVRDNGMGIAPEMLPRVFDLFAQADRALDRAEGGLGIGLTLVKRLVELHGGRVTAHSDGLDKGAEFVVRLAAELASREEPAQAQSGESAQRACARVLLVEDNADAAESLRMLLELLGHHVRVVHDGNTALDVAQASVPDVMLVDIGLPGIDGYQVARLVRRHPDLKRVVLVALTGYGRAEDRQLALNAGFDYHLVKPIDPTALQDLVASLGKDEPPKAATLH